jgi:hypothetical protein
MPKRSLDSGERPEDYWLRAKLIKTLHYAIKREAIYPNRPTLYDRLEDIEKAARLLIDRGLRASTRAAREAMSQSLSANDPKRTFAAASIGIYLRQ